jgi:hypothetical protein
MRTFVPRPRQTDSPEGAARTVPKDRPGPRRGLLESRAAGKPSRLRTLPSSLIRGGSDHLIAAVSPRQPDSLHFSRPGPSRASRINRLAQTGARTARSTRPGGAGGWRDDAQAGMPSDEPRAQLAFKDSMIRGILQFTLRIAFRCVLHRCKSQDIRC